VPKRSSLTLTPPPRPPLYKMMVKKDRFIDNFLKGNYISQNDCVQAKLLALKSFTPYFTGFTKGKYIV